MIGLKQSRIIHTLKTINDRSAHKCHATCIFSHLQICINLTDSHWENNLYFVFFPHSFQNQITFFHICTDIFHFSIDAHLNRARTRPGWNMNSQNGFFLCFSGHMIGHFTIPWIITFHRYIHLVKMCLCPCRNMRIHTILCLAPQIFSQRHQKTNHIRRATCTGIPARTFRQYMLMSI